MSEFMYLYVKSLYQDGIIGKEGVLFWAEHGKITKEQYEIIVGEPYPNK